MPTLGFLSVGEKKFTLKHGEAYVVGCMSQDYPPDIEINDKSVDIKHCILDFTEPIPRIFDIKSKCGTFVDHERIPSCSMHQLKKSTNIQIGCVDAILELAIEGDSGFLEDRLSPQIKESGIESTSHKQTECQAKNSPVSTANLEHEFIVPTGPARALSKSRDNSKTNDSLDSFTIPETQLPPKDAFLEVGDGNEDSFFIPETQDAVNAVAMLNNYPRVAFENEDVNETAADLDKIPSSQFRICTQDFNGSADELSNNSDDILANVPCSMVIPAIRHSTIHIDDVAEARDKSEDEKELSALRWSKTTDQTTRDASTPDGICAADNLTVPNQGQLEIPKQSSQCSTPDIFADNELLMDDMEKSLKENDPPLIVAGSVKQTHAIQKTFLKHASSTPNCKTDLQELLVDKSPLPPTQLFLLPTAKPKHTSIVEKQKSADVIDDLPPTQVFQQAPPKSNPGSALPSVQLDFDMQPTQVFQPVPPKSKPGTALPSVELDFDMQPTQVFQPAPPKTKTGTVLSSTLLDSAMQLSECSFKAQCNKLLDSDDDEMDEVVAPELVQKYRQSLENAKESNSTPPVKKTGNVVAPPQESNINPDNEKMLPPKNVPTPAAKETPVVDAKKQKPESLTKYANIDDFLCTPDFLGREFAKEGNLKRKAEQNWKNQRKPLFQGEKTPTKMLKNESDDSQDSFTDLITNKKKQEKVEEKLENKQQKQVALENENKPKLVEVEVRISRRRQSTKKQEPTVKKSTNSKPVPNAEGRDDNNVKKRGRKKIEPAVDKNDESSKANKSKDPQEERSSRHRQRSERNTSQTTSANNTVVDQDPKLVQEKDITPKSGAKPMPVSDKNDVLSRGKRSNESQEEDSSRQTHRSERKTRKTTNVNNLQVKTDTKRKTRRKSTTLSEDKVSKPPDDGGKPSLKEAPTTSTFKGEKQNSSMVSLDSSRTCAPHEEELHTEQRWKERRNLEVVLNKNGLKKPKIDPTKSSHKTDSDGSSRTHSKTRSSEVDGSKVSKTNSEVQVAVTPVLPDHPLPRENSKSASESEKVLNQDVVRVKKRNTVNKVEAEEEKPLRRVTRLRSAKQIGPSPTVDQPSEPTDLKSSRPTRSRAKTPKEPEVNQSSYDTVNTTNETIGSHSKVQSSSSGVKRKSHEEDVESKRSKPAGSDNIQTSDRKTKQKPKIAMTMCDPRYQEVLEKHSGMHWVYTGDPKECDVLILEKSNRTYKLMVAIARGIPVVKLDWLKEVLKKKSTSVPMDEYIFDDAQFQERHQFVMKKSLSLAKSTSLFKGVTFMTTPNIRPSPSEMKDIITCAGGTVLEQMPKQKQQIYLVSHANDNQYWHQYRRSNSKVRIVTTEGVMASVMQQSDGPLIRSIIQ